MDRHAKINVQSAVRAGDLTQHLRLHVLEVLNWLPLAILVLVGFVLLRHEERALDLPARG